jgi:hypothetical protein
MSLQPTLGHLKETSDRAAWWLDVYGSLDVPLTNPLAVTMLVGETEGAYYLIDLSKLDESQFEKVCQHIVKRFGADPDEVRAKLKEDGNLPIRESEIERVSFDARLAL